MLGEPLGIIKKIFNVSMVGGPKWGEPLRAVKALGAAEMCLW
jgi:hypothetical protein